MIIADGSMEDLDGKWILAKDMACPEKDASPATLGLPNMAGWLSNDGIYVPMHRLSVVTLNSFIFVYLLL